MHFLVIAAFALVLSTRAPTRSWWLFESTGLTYAFVVGQLVLIALLSLLSALWVIRRLSRQPWDPDSAQRLFSRCGAIIRGLILVSLGTDVLLTPWMAIVRKQWGLDGIVALDDLAGLLPFFVATVLFWTMEFPAERAIRRLAADRTAADGTGVRPVWRLAEYLIFNTRFHLLPIVIPMSGILVAYDLSARYSRQLYGWTRLDYADQVAVVLAAGLMFMISPWILRYAWSTRVLPSGELRDGLQIICDRIRMRYQEILIWQTEGGMVNACVMGLMRLWRYIFLSDGLLETMREDQIRAVFGHEAGHVKHHHIPFFLLFAAMSMLLVGAMLLLVWEYLPYPVWKRWLGISRSDWHNATDLGTMGLVLLVWVFGFGWLSRRFEWQADVFGVRCVGWTMETCGDPDCGVHHPSADGKRTRKTLCPAAADVFAESLGRIALLNGMAPNARSWRHGSIAMRMAFVRALASDTRKLRRFNRTIVLTKLVLVIGTAAGCAYAAYEYWPEHFIRYWFGK